MFWALKVVKNVTEIRLIYQQWWRSKIKIKAVYFILSFSVWKKSSNEMNERTMDLFYFSFVRQWPLQGLKIWATLLRMSMRRNEKSRRIKMSIVPFIPTGTQVSEWGHFEVSHVENKINLLAPSNDLPTSCEWIKTFFTYW